THDEALFPPAQRAAPRLVVELEPLRAAWRDVVEHQHDAEVLDEALPPRRAFLFDEGNADNDDDNSNNDDSDDSDDVDDGDDGDDDDNGDDGDDDGDDGDDDDDDDDDDACAQVAESVDALP